MRPEQYRQLAQQLPSEMQPTELQKQLSNHPSARIVKMSKDSSGLGSIAAAGLIGMLGYMLAKGRQNKLLARAAAEGRLVSPSTIKPLLALIGGAGAGVGGKILYDKYNKKDHYQY